MVPFWSLIILGIGVLVITVIGTFVLTRLMIKKQLENNPPINEDMIRAMFTQMGRKPSESQVNSVMASMKNANKKGMGKK